jgi:NADP-dependent aldehyde dehydrogenase
VVVFAASNFPFAFSVAGGDTAAALAAGCPVILKAHAGHPALSAATARLVAEALQFAGAPQGVFQILYGRNAGIAALTHPLVKAAAFTGSIPGGRALFDLASSRPEPIPFYGELGSLNPVFVSMSADSERGDHVAEALVTSFTLGAGQFCTKPGVVFVPIGSRLLKTLHAWEMPPAAPLLNGHITHGNLTRQRELRDHPGIDVVAEGSDPLGDPPSPTVLATTIAELLRDPGALLAECFGPTVLVVEYDTEDQLIETAHELEGQLTATLVANEDDQIARDLAPVLARKAGRLLWNQWPTGVSVTYAQQHGGPYPATTAPGTTSVGTASIDRFTRPVSYQGFPQSLLPDELRDDHDIPRRVDGRLSN